jgi:UDP-glucose 4-epimerase
MHVLIAGVAGTTGRLLAETGLAVPEITRMTGLDPRPCLPPIAGMRFARARFHQPEWTPLLHDVDTVIHVTGAEWPAPRCTQADVTLFEDTRFVVDAALAAGVRKLIVVTNAALYGQHEANQPIDESAPVRGHEASAYARVRARMSDYLDVIAARGTPTLITRLRTAWISGARHTALARYARTEPVLVRGCLDNTLDVVHEQDVIAAILLTLHDDLPGVYNVSAEEPITFRELAALAGHDHDPVSLARVVLRAWWRWRWRGKPTPPGWVRGLYRAGLLDAQKLRAAGWQPQYTARDALQAAIGTTH